ncbi:glycosyltransferase [Streptomyces sp. NBRC 14336]|uniref:glycosyltransferase n=1 Tax=Streptomyces sp. NBRC 14336 TaxID=3030992 RepID=UPI002557ACA5|nr:glycosyltransferase [Streptomyces sp. NBRC 14336]
MSDRRPEGLGESPAGDDAAAPRAGPGTRWKSRPAPSPEGRAPLRFPPRRAGPGVRTALYVLPAALALWLLSLRDVHLDRMDDLGLLQVLPVTFWVALALLALGFCVALTDRRTPHGCYALYVLALIGLIHATPPLLYSELRYAWAWKHVAVIDAMIRHNGEVPDAAGLGIYNQWPGFFQFNAMLMRVAGLESPLGYAMWAQVLVNVAMLGPLLLIYRSVTTNRRMIWAAAWIYYSCSWVGQDYFAPQAFTFLLYATVIALVLRQLAASAHPDPQAPPPGWPPGRFVLLLVVEAAIVTSHQLTPLMLISALLLLCLPRRNRPVVLPALAGAFVLNLAWYATVARPYVSEHLSDFVSAITRPEANVWSGLNRLAEAAPAQVAVAWIDRGLSGGIFLLAAVACLVHRWTRRTPMPLLVLSPIPLALVNAYGGEMVFRAYMFALPAAAFLVATLLVPPPGRPRARTAVVYVVLLAMLGGLVFGYYSKESMNRFSAGEVAATRYVTTRTPDGSLIVSVTFAAPGLETHYDRHERAEITEESLATRRLLAKDPLAGLQPLLRRAGDKPAYILLTRAQNADVRLNGSMPRDFVDRLNAELAEAPGFTPVYRNEDAIVYRYLPPREEAPG